MRYSAARYGLILALAFLPASAVSQRPGGNQEPTTEDLRRPEEAAKANQAGSAPPAHQANPGVVAQEDQPKAKAYKSTCGDTDNHPEADLCEQKKMAISAREAADYAFYQMWIGGAGLAAVGFSLWFTGWAAVAASRAAKSAADTAQIMLSSERPFVALEITEPGIEMMPNGTIEIVGKLLRFSLTNHGRTPALLQELKESYTVINGLADAPTPLDPMKDRGRMLPVGTVSSTSSAYKLATNLFTQASGIVEILAPDAWKNRKIFFQGFIRYSDQFGRYYITGFLFRFSPVHNAWALRGDERYNYHREEKSEGIPAHPDYAA